MDGADVNRRRIAGGSATNFVPIAIVALVAVLISLVIGWAVVSLTPIFDSGVVPAASVSGLSSGDPDALSVLSATVLVQGADLGADRFMLTATVTVALLLIVALPSVLLRRTLAGGANRERQAPTRVGTQLDPRAAKHPWGRVGAVLALATFIACFVDPGFGFNLGSLRLFVSIAVAFAIQNLLGWWLVRRAVRLTDPDLTARVHVNFASLAVLLVAVVVSRLVGFEPGLLLGLLVGMVFGTTLSRTRRGRVVLIGVGYSFALGVVGWFGYSMIVDIAGTHGGFWFTFAAETFSGLALSGLAALPLALLPLGGLSGGAVFGWMKRAWAIPFAITIFAFFIIVLPLPSRWDGVGAPLLLWVGLFVAFAVFAILWWARSRFLKPAPAN